MNLHGNTEAEFVEESQAGEYPIQGSIATSSRCDGGEPTRYQDRAIFEALFNALSDAAVLTRIEGEIWLVNHRFTTLFGFHPHEVIGKPMALVCADTTEAADTIASERFPPHGRTGDVTTPVDVRYRSKENGRSSAKRSSPPSRMAMVVGSAACT